MDPLLASPRPQTALISQIRHPKKCTCRWTELPASCLYASSIRLRASIENARSDMLPIAMQTTRELEGLFHKDSSLFGVCIAD